jgi:hypothetical protein
MFLLLSLQIEWPDLKDRDDPRQMLTSDCSFLIFSVKLLAARCFLAATDSFDPKQNGPNGAGEAELGPLAGDRSWRKRLAASLSVPAGSFGSRAAITGRIGSRCG